MYFSHIRIAENAINLKKSDIVKNASAILGRVDEVYNRSLKAKELDPRKIEKLSMKYTQIDTAARLKSENQKKQWKMKREEYLEQLKKIEAAREAAERMQKEKTDEIMNALALKEEHARQSRMGIMEENARRRLQHKRTNKKQTDSSKLETLKRKQEEAKFRMASMKSYNESVRAIKKEVAARVRNELVTEDYSNPYIVAEMKVIKNLMLTQKKSIKKDANKTSSKFIVFNCSLVSTLHYLYI